MIKRTEGGQGGGRGHHGMEHYEYTEVIKEQMRRARREQDRVTVVEQMTAFDSEEDTGNRCPVCGPGPCDPESHEWEVWAFLADRMPDVFGPDAPEPTET